MTSQPGRRYPDLEAEQEVDFGRYGARARRALVASRSRASSPAP